MSVVKDSRFTQIDSRSATFVDAAVDLREHPYQCFIHLGTNYAVVYSGKQLSYDEFGRLLDKAAKAQKILDSETVADIEVRTRAMKIVGVLERRYNIWQVTACGGALKGEGYTVDEAVERFRSLLCQD